MKRGILFITSGPIGNLKDITIRALEVLRDVDFIVCEDTRITSKLLNRYKIRKKLISYHEGNEKVRRSEIISLLLSEKNIAILSDAGTPCISDPGETLVKECIKNEIKVEVLPGPSSVISSLVISGIDTTPFLFLGFFPKKDGERDKVIKKYFYLNSTIIFFESPHRLKDSIKYLLEKFPERRVALVKELTKLKEEIIRGTVGEIYKTLKDREIRGEWIVIIEGKEREEWEEDLDILIGSGFSKKEILKFMTEKYKGIRNRLYKRLESIESLKTKEGKLKFTKRKEEEKDG